MLPDRTRLGNAALWAEIGAGLLLSAAAGVMAIAYAAGILGLPVRAVPILAVASLLAALVVREASPGSRGSGAGPGGFVLVVSSIGAYALWLSWPSLLPRAEGPDLVHHLSLIHFIQERGALPRDPAIEAYLGEMFHYTPGSHLLAGILANAAGTDAVWVVQPILACALALKAGLVYSVLGRTLPESPGRTPLAAAGAFLLLIPHPYLLQPVTHYGFFAQVVSETFAVAMLWALVVWRQEGSGGALALFGLFGVAVFLSWPVFLGAPVLAFPMVLAERRPALRDGMTALSVALGPVAAFGAWYTAGRLASAGSLMAPGLAVVPGAAVFGLLPLALAGTAASLRSWRDRLPVLAFAVACLAETAALFFLQWWRGGSTFYITLKSVHLLVDALVVLSGIGLAWLWSAARDRAGWHVTACPRAAWIVLILVILWAAGGMGLPLRPLRSPITEPILRAGLWARSNVPAACVDYLVPHWLTGYWLHLDVLGNPRMTDRMKHETFEYKVTLGRWILPGGLPYGIVEDVARLPPDVRRNLRVLQRFGTAAVVERTDGKSRCEDTAKPIRAMDFLR